MSANGGDKRPTVHVCSTLCSLRMIACGHVCLFGFPASFSLSLSLCVLMLLSWWLSSSSPPSSLPCSLSFSFSVSLTRSLFLSLVLSLSLSPRESRLSLVFSLLFFPRLRHRPTGRNDAFNPQLSVCVQCNDESDDDRSLTHPWRPAH